MCGAQTALTRRYLLPLEAVGDGAAVDSVGTGKVVHRLARLVTLGDLGSFGGRETALNLTRRTRRRWTRRNCRVRPIQVRPIAEGGKDVCFPREMFCKDHPYSPRTSGAVVVFRAEQNYSRAWPPGCRSWPKRTAPTLTPPELSSPASSTSPWAGSARLRTSPNSSRSSPPPEPSTSPAPSTSSTADYSPPLPNHGRAAAQQQLHWSSISGGKHVDSGGRDASGACAPPAAANPRATHG